MLTSSAMWCDDRRETLQAIRRQGADVELERQVRDGGGQVGIAGPLAVAVDAALDLGHPGLDGHQRVGHRAAGVVVAVDAQLRAGVGPHVGHGVADVVGQRTRRWCRTAPAPRRRLLGPRPGPRGRTRGCGGSRRRSVRRRGRRAGRGRAGRPPSRATMATASSSEVRRASATWRSHVLATMQADRCPGPDQVGQYLVVLGSHAGPPGRAEGHQRGRVERELLGRAVEELDVLGVGARASRPQ